MERALKYQTDYSRQSTQLKLSGLSYTDFLPSEYGHPHKLY